MSPSRTQESVLVHSGTLIDPNGVRPGWVLIEAGRVAAVGAADEPMPEASRVVDASNGYVTPGFVDMHCNGAGGANFQDGTEQALTAARALQAHGATRVVASIVTSSIDNTVESIRSVVAAMKDERGILGVHVEGPFLGPGRKGAHDPRLLSDPSRDAIDRLLDAAEGHIRHFTLAPELPGALDAVEYLVEAGVPVAIGHSDCDYDTAREAFARGASIVTHAFNAMGPIQGRSPGLLGAAIEASHVTIEVIADGIHVHPASIHLLFAAAPDRIALVTDAMAGAAAPAGRYLLGTMEVEVRGDRAVVAGTDTLAGSTLTPERAVRVAVEQCGVTMKDAVSAFTTVPARAVGERAPAIDAGSRAELVILDSDLSVVEVLIG